MHQPYLELAVLKREAVLDMEQVLPCQLRHAADAPKVEWAQSLGVLSFQVPIHRHADYFFQQVQVGFTHLRQCSTLRIELCQSTKISLVVIPFLNLYKQHVLMAWPGTRVLYGWQSWNETIVELECLMGT